MGAVISCPEFAVGESYYVYVGGKQQSYTGTDVAMGPGGMEQSGAEGEPNIIFIMGDTVNSFSGVSDYTATTDA